MKRVGAWQVKHFVIPLSCKRTVPERYEMKFVAIGLDKPPTYMYISGKSRDSNIPSSEADLPTAIDALIWKLPSSFLFAMRRPFWNRNKWRYVLAPDNLNLSCCQTHTTHCRRSSLLRHVTTLQAIHTIHNTHTDGLTVQDFTTIRTQNENQRKLL